MKFDEQAALRRAYITLLELPHAALRARMQPVLATLRDEIAVGAGLHAETIQNMYEDFVRENPNEYAHVTAIAGSRPTAASGAAPTDWRSRCSTGEELC